MSRSLNFRLCGIGYSIRYPSTGTSKLKTIDAPTVNPEISKNKKKRRKTEGTIILISFIQAYVRSYNIIQALYYKVPFLRNDLYVFFIHL